MSEGMPTHGPSITQDTAMTATIVVILIIVAATVAHRRRSKR